jgi:hypothetical protein
MSQGKGKTPLAYQLARAACGGLAALTLSKAVDLSVEGNHEFWTYAAFYGIGGASILLAVWLSLVINRQKETVETLEPRTRPLTWGDLKQMRVPLESDSAAEEVRGARRCARHIHAELEANRKRANKAIKHGFWWNVTFEGLQSDEWTKGKDLLADVAPKVYDAIAPVYVLIDAMNVQANNHLQGGHDDFNDETAQELRSLRAHINTAQRTLQNYYSN